MARTARRRPVKKLDQPTRVASSPFVVIARGRDGVLRSERFTDLTAYRERLKTLRESDGGLSIADIAALLDSGHG